MFPRIVRRRANKGSRIEMESILHNSDRSALRQLLRPAGECPTKGALDLGEAWPEKPGPTGRDRQKKRRPENGPRTLCPLARTFSRGGGAHAVAAMLQASTAAKVGESGTFSGDQPPSLDPSLGGYSSGPEAAVAAASRPESSYIKPQDVAQWHTCYVPCTEWRSLATRLESPSTSISIASAELTASESSSPFLSVTPYQKSAWESREAPSRPASSTWLIGRTDATTCRTITRTQVDVSPRRAQAFDYRRAAGRSVKQRAAGSPSRRLRRATQLKKHIHCTCITRAHLELDFIRPLGAKQRTDTLSLPALTCTLM